MSEYRSNVSLAEAVRMIREADRIAITTHVKPDGDAFGSVAALAGALKQLGKDAPAWLMPPAPQQFKVLQGWGLTQLYGEASSLSEPDLVVVLDTGAWSQMPAMREDLTRVLDRTLIVDHHLTGDVPAAWRYIDGQAAACCEIVAELIDELQAQSAGNGTTPTDLFTPAVCEALFVGLASDTGWFRFSNTRPESHELAGRLLRLGVDHAGLYSKLEQNERPQKLALMIRALDSLRLVADQRAAVMVLRSEDFQETGALLEETERFVDAPQVVTSVRVVALITQPPTAPDLPLENAPRADAPSTVRLSFRSKPGLGSVNVSELAQRFGGGGHAKAAGAQMHAPLEKVIDQVTNALVEAVEQPVAPR